MSNHSERPHHILSASGAERWMKCPPSALLEQQFPDTTSGAASEGTLAHEICEVKATNYIDPKRLSKRSMNAKLKKLKERELYDPEMDGYTDEYVEFISKEALSFTSAPYIVLEQKLDLDNWIPGGFGTGDCIMIHGGILEIIDFKYGKGVKVDAQNNPQLQLYALGAYAAYSLLYPIERVRMSIVQPRLEHFDTWEISLEELLKFGELVKEKASLAFKGEGDFNPGESQCRFCRAKARCRARAERNVQLAFFTDKKPALLTGDQIGEYLAKGTDVAKWLEELKAYALSECLAGKTIAGYKAVAGKSSRAWTSQEEAFRKLNENGYEDAVLYERNPLSLAKVEKLVGKKDFNNLVGEYVVKSPGKPTLVPESDKRVAITNVISAKDAFNDKEE